MKDKTSKSDACLAFAFFVVVYVKSTAKIGKGLGNSKFFIVYKKETEEAPKSLFITSRLFGTISSVLFLSVTLLIYQLELLFLGFNPCLINSFLQRHKKSGG